MEMNKTLIARLVLGYLKSQNCRKAFNEFLLKSALLKSYAVKVKQGIDIPTRVNDLTLEQIILEYSDISFIIKGKLERTDYYEKGLRLSLVDQLNYILGNDMTPPSQALPTEIEATPSESLPGNSSYDSSVSPPSTQDRSGGPSRECTPLESESEVNVTDGSSKKEEKSLEIDLDNQITTLKHKAEKDPVFDKLLEEMLGTKNETPAKNQDAKITENVKIPDTSQNYSSPLHMEIPGDTSKKTPQESTNYTPSDANMLKTTPTQQGTILLANNGGLLMVPNYIVLNSQAPQNKSWTEADIMKMPTLILDDSYSCQSTQPLPGPPQQTQPMVKLSQLPIAPAVTQSQIIVTAKPQMLMASQPSAVHTKPVKTLKTLAPKTDKITLATSDGDFYKVLDDAKSPEKAKGRPGLRSRSIKSKQKPETPPKKDESSSSNDTSKKKSAKSLFKENKKGETWDADLRKLVAPNKPKEPVESDEDMDTTDNQMDISINDEELKREAMMIEAAFKTPVKNREDTKDEKEEVKSVTKTKIVMESEEIVTEETEVYLRNCNGPPRIKKKCNLTTTTSELFEVVEIVEVEESPCDKLKHEKPSVVLETPVKEVFPPKTPGKCELTPFSRAIDEQLQDMDLLNLPTPSLDTPSFPITPCVQLNTPDHASRPTDYSTSSSYYQPSDTEQNKSLEAVMNELKKNKEPEKVENKTEEIKRMFNKNVIGKKNLNLLKKNDSSDSDKYNSETASSSSSNDSSSDSDFEPRSKITPENNQYSFRKRKITPKTEEKPKKPPTARKKPETPKNPPKKKKTSNETKNSPKETERPENENEITDDDFALHLSTDEDSTNKGGVDGTTVPVKNKEHDPLPLGENSKQLIQDLYDRGIHLLPKYRTSGSGSGSEENRVSVLKDLDVSSNSDDGTSSEDEEEAKKEVVLETRTFEEDSVIAVVHDYGKRKKKKTYNTEILQRKLQAEIYVEALDEMKKVAYTFTPINTLLERSPKKAPPKRRKSVKPSEIKVKLKTNEVKKETENKVKKTEDKTKGSENKEKRARVSGGKKTMSRSDSEASLKSENKESERKKSEESEHFEELMNLAVLGMQEEQNGEAKTKSREKRKLSSEGESMPPEKKTKTARESLLKKMDLDSFLNKVHGDSEEPM